MDLRGSKPGERRGGRKLGTPNKRTAMLRQETLEAEARLRSALGPDAFQGDAHAFLMAIYKDPSKPDDLRVDAAKAAVRYEKPALSASTVEVKDAMSTMTAEQLIALAALAPARLAEKPADDGRLH